MEKTKRIINTILPYILILIVSLLGTYLVFYKGINDGDDFDYHFGNILDQYRSIKDGHGLNPISGNLGLGFGVGNRLFYSPFTHFFISLVFLIIDGFNTTIISAFEIVTVLSVFVSGVFMYRFAMHFSKNNKVASLIAACIFVLYPYRLFDAFCRIAIAEAMSIAFLPLFFMGLYDITHFDKKVNSIAFIEIIIGGSLLFLSHNITALYAFTAGIIYLLVNIKSIIKSFKLKRYVIYAAISVFLLVGIASIGLFSQLELVSSGIYVVSDDVKMWTSIEQVTGRANESLSYSGFLNITFLKSILTNIMTVSTLIISTVMFIVSCMVFIILDRALSEVKKLKYFRLLITVPLLFLLVSLIGKRLEIYLATVVFVVIYFYIIFNVSTINLYQKDETKKLYKDNMFWFCIAMCILLVFMMENKTVWEHMPKLYRNIQFPWRLWALVQIFVSIIIGLLIHYFNYKKFVYSSCAVLAAFLLVTSMPLIEKRVYNENYFERKWFSEVVEEDLYLNWRTLGFCREYLPLVLLDEKHESEYSNSLHRAIRTRLDGDYSKFDPYKVSPTFLIKKPELTKGENGNFYINGLDTNITFNENIDESDVKIAINGNWQIGIFDSKIKAKVDGDIIVNDAYSPRYDMNITVNDDSMVQMPLIYYPGYEITITDLENGESYTVNGENVDGLMAFEIKEGNYKVTTDYKGTPLRKTSKVYFYISISLTSLALLYGLFIENEKYKKLLKLVKKDKKVANK